MSVDVSSEGCADVSGLGSDCRSLKRKLPTLTISLSAESFSSISGLLGFSPRFQLWCFGVYFRFWCVTQVSSSQTRNGLAFWNEAAFSFNLLEVLTASKAYYIPIPLMPPMPPGIAGLPLSSSGSSETIASVVNMSPAIEAAFCSAVRVTLAGSITPALTRSS